MLPLLLTLLLAETAAPSTQAPGSVADILEEASRWVVAVEVNRSKDLPPSIFQPRRISQEGRSFFQRPVGCVSGILLDGEGHVLTSFYNVGGDATSIKVTLATGKSYPAKLLGKSVQDDAALLRIDGGDAPLQIPAPRWAGAGGAADTRAGKIVFALGRSPDPSRITVTRGIVSASRRNGGRALQTDAELNYGNSGGPIVDLDGRIVAMAGFIGHTQPQWGVNSGVGFGTKAGVLLDMLTRLKAGEDVTAFEPAFLGVHCSPEPAGEIGALVQKVEPNAAAEKAGIQSSDVILELGGEPIYDFDRLRLLIFSRRPGEKVELKVRRGAESLRIEAILGAMPKA